MRGPVQLLARPAAVLDALARTAPGAAAVGAARSRGAAALTSPALWSMKSLLVSVPLPSGLPRQRPDSMGVLIDWPGTDPHPARFVFLAGEKAAPAKLHMVGTESSRRNG